MVETNEERMLVRGRFELGDEWKSHQMTDQVLLKW